MAAATMTLVFAPLGKGLWLIVRAARGIGEDVIEEDELARDRLAAAFDRFGWRPIPTLAALAALIGLAIGVAASRTLQSFYAERLVEPVLTRVLARDIVPLLIGIFAAGRVAVETAVRLGAMRLNSELDALRAIGHDPVRFVVTPALAAVLIATPIQMAIVFASAWFGVAAALDWNVVTSFAVMAHTTLNAASFAALLTGCAKAWLFGVVALAVGATVGTSEARGISALGRQSTRAFTTGLLLVITIAVVAVVLQ